MGSPGWNVIVTIVYDILANMRVGHLYLLIFFLMTLSESSAGLTLAEFLYRRLGPSSKSKLESDYHRHRHNTPSQHHSNSQKQPTQIPRGPKFIESDVRPGQTKGKQVNRAVASFRQALNNIVGIKESLFRTLLHPRPRGKNPYEAVGTGQGSEDIPIVGGSSWQQFNSENNYFRPSLTDPLRPTLKMTSSVPAGGGGGGGGFTPTQFLPPRERTKIDTAVVGQQVKPRRPEKIEIKTQSYHGPNLVPVKPPVEKLKGRLKVPDERTRIDTAVFADDIFQNKSLPPSSTRNFEPLSTSQTEAETFESPQVILGGEKSQINALSPVGGWEAENNSSDLTVFNSTPIILKKTKLRLQNPYAEVAYTDNDLKGSGNIEDLDTAETVSDVLVRSNNIKAEIINSLEEKSQEFDCRLSIPKSSKTEILSEKED